MFSFFFLRQLEKDLEEEHKREVERQKERAAEKDWLRAQQLEERKRREKEEIEKANLSEEEKRRLLKEHGDNMRHLEVSCGVAQDSGFFFAFIISSLFILKIAKSVCIAVKFIMMIPVWDRNISGLSCYQSLNLVV